MATLKQRIHKKNANGEYDTVYFETLASLVKMADGKDLETVVNGKADSNHTHTQYASTSHLHDDRYSLTSHVHDNYVATSVWWNSYANLTALKSGLGLSTTPVKFASGSYDGKSKAGGAGSEVRTLSFTFTCGFTPKLLCIIDNNTYGFGYNGTSYNIMYTGQLSENVNFSPEIIRSYVTTSTGITITATYKNTSGTSLVYYVANAVDYSGTVHNYYWVAFG